MGDAFECKSVNKLHSQNGIVLDHARHLSMQGGKTGARACG